MALIHFESGKDLKQDKTCEFATKKKTASQKRYHFYPLHLLPSALNTVEIMLCFYVYVPITLTLHVVNASPISTKQKCNSDNDVLNARLQVLIIMLFSSIVYLPTLTHYAWVLCWWIQHIVIMHTGQFLMPDWQIQTICSCVNFNPILAKIVLKTIFGEYHKCQVIPFS